MRFDVGLPILNYHILGGSGSAVETTVHRFLTTMQRLLDAGFRCVDLSDWIRSGRPAIERGFALTFDDGDRSLLEVADAFPRLGLNATVFLVTDFVGRTNNWPGQPSWVPRSVLLDWSEIRDLASRGFAFGSHTVSHPDLRRCNTSQLGVELVSSQASIETELGLDCRLLAYPYGGISARIRGHASQNYRAALGTTLGIADERDDLYRLPRIDAFYLREGCLLDRLIEGHAEAWLRMRRGMRFIKSTLTVGVTGWTS